MKVYICTSWYSTGMNLNFHKTEKVFKSEDEANSFCHSFIENINDRRKKVEIVDDDYDEVQNFINCIFKEYQVD